MNDYSKLKAAEDINILARFCGMRDVRHLTGKEVKEFFGRNKADVMVLFGGSIQCGGDLLAAAMREGIASKYVIVGGAGHTTEALRRRINEQYPKIETDGLSEAVVFERYIETVYGLKADLLETESTNCGNNITYLLGLLKANMVESQSFILMQDASMQRRMDAGLRKYAPEAKILNYAAYAAEVCVREGQLAYREQINGMWDMHRYVELLMGEIPRLHDDAAGYGPNGKGFIAHVDIPEEVESAYTRLQKMFGNQVRAANPLYAGR